MTQRTTSSTREKIIAAVEDVANVALHATVAALAVGIPANIATSGQADVAWLIGAGAAGAVAAAHAVGRILQALKS